jgi:putative restriction endonuclease
VGSNIHQGNAALRLSCERRYPVRVIRGPKTDPAFAPTTGLRYDGLFMVHDARIEQARSGFQICRFVLRSLDPQAQAAPSDAPFASVARVNTQIQRIVRTTAVINRIKRLYQDRCQICRQSIDTSFGAYSEGAHVQGLGAPHSGPDVVENALCLCPNDHVRFDTGAFLLSDDLQILSASGRADWRCYLPP